MSFEVTVTPQVYDVEVEINPSVLPFEVQVNALNGMQLNLSTNGDSGAATFDPFTDELNIPNYTLDGLGGVPETRTITINGTTQDLSTNRTFTVPVHDAVTIGSPANGLAIDPNQVLTIELASGSQAGALSSADWSTFNGKQNALGYTPEDVANKSTDTGLGTSNTLYPSQGAVKSYVDTGLSGKQNTLGFTPENVSNKAINLTSPDDTKYPTTLAISTALAGKENTITAGTTAQYYRGDKTFQDFASAVRSTLLTGFTVGTNTAITASDTVLSAFQNLQGQVNARVSGTGTSGQVAFWNGTSSQTGSTLFTIDTVNRSVSLTGASVTNILNITSTALSSALRFEENSVLKGLVQFVGSTFSVANRQNYLEIQGASGIAFRSSGEMARFMNNNFLINTTTDAGFRLDVNGTARVQGALSVTTGADVTPLTISGYSLTGSNAQSALSITGTWNTTGTPTALLVNVTDTASNAASLLCSFQVGGLNRFSVRKDGQINFTAASISNGGGVSAASFTAGPTNISFAFNTFTSQFNYTNTSGDTFQFRGLSTFNPTSGTGTITGLGIQNTINQTGGANGITRGLYVNPTLTAAADWRSIEWSNNTGRGLWGVGTADNAIAGALNVGSATNANASAILEITSTTRGLLLPRMTGAQAELIGTPADGLLVYINNGNGVTINSTGFWGRAAGAWVKLN